MPMAGKVSPLRTAPLTKPRAAVLVVEDDPDVAMSINDIVEERGYRAICVSNGREALSVLEKERPALMLVDLFMPIRSGGERLRLVNQTPRRAGFPRAIRTAATAPMITIKEGVAVLCKPVDFDALGRLLQK